MEGHNILVLHAFISMYLLTEIRYDIHKLYRGEKIKYMVVIDILRNSS